MQTRKLGNSDLMITPIGFGSWAIGGTGYAFAWGPQDDDQSVEAIHKALDMGVNWIDTAAVYGLGHSEEVVARAVEGWSGSRPYVFTKCGLVWDDDAEVVKTLRGDSIRRECEASLRRLKVDAIDLYQIHWPTEPNDPDEDAEGWRTMAELQREGKVRWIGVSNWNVPQLQMAQEIAPVTSLQPPYSLINDEVEREILPFCERNGIGTIVYSPMGSGLLTGGMTRERAENFPESDWRRRNPEFQEPRLSRNLAIADALREIGEAHGRSAGEVAIAWTLRLPSVTGAIVGARSAEQVQGVMGGGDFRLSDEEIARIEALRGGE
ncbi:MAG TPA: aldo/keto reductase [Longimicrobium sp.]|jgi:aryl-alcohol dehydrogenase-like predicted oxidoreductase|uniref:aldo/keto reductase n=1 Tax=Longimicrobium sp. TaxID=2029185 RepID=UPI002ED9F739